jgi:excisionase family DNA binding protein
MTQQNILMTVSEVARRLHCSLSNAYNLIRSSKLRAFRVGAGSAGLRVSEEQLQEFLARSMAPPEEIDQAPLKHLR